MVAAIRGFHHGGSLLLVSESAFDRVRTKGDVVRRCQRMKAPSRHLTWNSGLLNFATAFAVLLERERKERGTQRLLEATALARFLWGRQARLTAHLTQVDGILACNELLEPLATGLVVDLVASVSMSAELKQALEFRGTRHASMAIAVGAFEDALGVTVSQDGDVTLFWLTDGGAVEAVETWT